MNLSKVHAVILAGGKGTRLKPYTTFVPKPLMPIGDLPIIEVVIKQLQAIGIRDITLAVGHQAQLIQAFVSTANNFGMNVDYSFENTPLGTAGPLSLLSDKLSKTDCFLTLNGDVLTTLDYKRAIEFHLSTEAAATICVNRREVAIDFGVIDCNEDGSLKGYTEKPTLRYDVSMGINIFSPKALSHIPQNTPFTIPDLMIALKKNGERVMCYNEESFWLDIGRVEDYHQACEIFEKRRSEFLPNG